jgi:Family of unknown function (DUF6356)
MDMQRLFSEHPASVGETYWEHLLRAGWFGVKMLVGAGACFIHAVLPFLFVKTGSATIQQLHTAMVTHRRVTPEAVDLAAPGQLRVAK